MLDAHKLATLRSVVECGSFSAAAAALHLTQPAVSRQVSALETQVGVPLVHRTQRGVAATEAGEVLLGHADAVLGRLAMAEADVREFAGERRGTIRLGSFITALTHVSAELAGILSERHPELVIDDDLVDRETALAKVVGGELDAAVVFLHDFQPDPGVDLELEVMPLFDDPVRVLLPTGHRLARKRRVDPRALADDVWITAFDGTGAELTAHVLTTVGLSPPTLLAGHGDEPIEAQALVAAGRGVAVAHAMNVAPVPEGIVSKPLDGYDGVRRVEAVRMSRRSSPAVEAAWDGLREIATRRSRRRYPHVAASWG